MKILVSPSGFKESLEPNVAADCIESGILRAFPEAEVIKAPLVDGGEGFVKALIEATGGEIRNLMVMGPVRKPVASHYGILGGTGPRTAVIEMAAAAGLRLVPQGYRNPGFTTTFGVGQTIAAALEDGIKHFLIGCGDSGTCDGGVGMLQALGARFFSKNSEEIPLASGGATLLDLAFVDLSSLNPLLKNTEINVACNWHNILCGPEGVASVFGPQKGGSPSDVKLLSQAMDNVASAFGKQLGRDISRVPGSGASGGLGSGLMLIGAILRPRYDLVMEFLDIDSLLCDCDLVFTAEGSIDSQTIKGKIPAEVAMRAKKIGLPVIALAGTIGENAAVNYEAGIDAFCSILQRPSTLQEAILQAEDLLTDSAELAMRMILIGRSIKQWDPLNLAHRL